MINVCLKSVNVPGENSGTKGQTGTKGQGQIKGYSLPPYAKNRMGLYCPRGKFPCPFTNWNLGVRFSRDDILFAPFLA